MGDAGDRAAVTSRVLVVGGTGILRPAVDALLAAGREVTVLGRSADRLAALPPAAAGVLGDLDDPAALAAVLAAASTAAGRPNRFGACLAYLPAVADLTRSVPADPADGADRSDDPGRADLAGLAALRALRAAVDGPLVAVLTSAVAAPPAADDPAAVLAALARRLADPATPAADLRLLLLGWAGPTPGASKPAEPSGASEASEAPGPARWHTPAEISAAALAVLRDPAPARLGVLRPWADRPR